MKKGIFLKAVFCFNIVTGTIFSGPRMKHNTSAPDFLILGVTKCGTTSLYDYIVKHPKILGSKKKELHFFTTYYKRGSAWYRRQFPVKKSHDQLIGEATPGYFWKKDCDKKILKHSPTTKFIVIFRNPVKRIVSEYFRLQQRGEEVLDFDHAIARPDLQDRYIGAGLYSEHLERWLSQVPRNQILVLILEDVAQDPEREVNKVFAFLGLQEFKLDSYALRNQAKYDMGEINSETIEALKKLYAPYNKKLEKILGRALPW